MSNLNLKYLKYKKKYFNLKNQIGGVNHKQEEINRLNDHTDKLQNLIKQMSEQNADYKTMEPLFQAVNANNIKIKEIQEEGNLTFQRAVREQDQERARRERSFSERVRRQPRQNLEQAAAWNPYARREQERQQQEKQQQERQRRQEQERRRRQEQERQEQQRRQRKQEQEKQEQERQRRQARIRELRTHNDALGKVLKDMSSKNETTRAMEPYFQQVQRNDREIKELERL